MPEDGTGAGVVWRGRSAQNFPPRSDPSSAATIQASRAGTMNLDPVACLPPGARRL